MTEMKSLFLKSLAASKNYFSKNEGINESLGLGGSSRIIFFKKN